MDSGTKLHKPDVIKEILPILSILFALVLQTTIPNSEKHPNVEAPYFTYALWIGLAAYVVAFLLSFGVKSIQKWLIYKGCFIAGAVLFLNILNIITAKSALLPVLYFPSLDKVFGVLVTDRGLLGKCLLYSARLLLVGYFSGAIVGFICGIAAGFSKKVSYWLMPLVRLLGPIPSTAWIPLVLVCFP